MRIEASGLASPQVNIAADDSMQSAQRLTAKHACRVLVVDDDELVRARLSALLNLAQFDVKVATTGREALRILSATPCDIVLTDWTMPDMDGLELCRRVRLKTKESYVYVLMLTIRDTEPDMLAGLAAGADDYLVKGATVDELLARLETGRRITRDVHPPRTSNTEPQRSPYTDPVTGAHNGGYFAQHLSRELARSRRYGHALAVLTCQIDELEKLIDRIGSGPANDVLREFAARTNKCIRKGDWLARTGGNEFMIVLPETGTTGARCVIHKLSELFAQQPLSTPVGPITLTPRFEVTAIGVSHDVGSTSRIEALIHSTDRSGYAGKERNISRTIADTLTFIGELGARKDRNNGLN